MFPSTASSWATDVSPLKILISRATYPSQPEPNYALNLEVAEYINQKKANTPREAAMTVANLVNHRNPHIAMLALALLDTLVQSCGYPFYLQISTKEFLNELVRRFPERPPAFPPPVMSRILDLIHGWKEGICVESRWKDDLGNIRDMHRLLTFKGYRFRDIPRQPALQSTSNLKTAEELENEDREAQSAKLQELIRRGTPRDLAQAQELMKALAGANPDAKPDYRTQALTELNKLESKVILLNEMLDNVDVGREERFVKGDVYDQVASILASARPKIQGWISNAETEDPESLDTFLQINDQINTVLNRYELFKKGDYAAASNPIPAELGAGSSRSQAAAPSLIDFDDPTPAPAGGGTAPLNDLASLFGPSPSAAPQAQTAPPIVGMGMGNLGTGNPTASSTLFSSMSPHPTGFAHGMSANATPPTFNQATRPGAISPQFRSNTPNGTPPLPVQGSIRLPGTPQLLAQTTGGMAAAGSPAPNYFGLSNSMNGGGMHTGTAGFASVGGMGASPQVLQPQLQSQQHIQQQPTPSNTTSQSQGKDPFADLAGLF